MMGSLSLCPSYISNPLSQTAGRMCQVTGVHNPPSPASARPNRPCHHTHFTHYPFVQLFKLVPAKEGKLAAGGHGPMEVYIPFPFSLPLFLHKGLDIPPSFLIRQK